MRCFASREDEDEDEEVVVVVEGRGRVVMLREGEEEVERCFLRFLPNPFIYRFN